MKRQLLLLFLSVWALSLCAQTLTTKYLGEPRHVDSKANHYAATSDGGFIITGNTTANGNNDAYLWKVDSLGQTQWFKTYGHTGEENGTQVLVCADGGYLLGGNTAASSIDIKNPFLKKTDASGNVLWEIKLYHQQSEIVGSIIELPGGGWAATCYDEFNYSIGFFAQVVVSATGTLVKEEKLTGARATLCNAADGGYFIIKIYNSLTEIRRYNANLTLRWKRDISYSGYDYGIASIEGSNGRLYIVRATTSNNCTVQCVDSTGAEVYSSSFYVHFNAIDGLREKLPGQLEFYVMPGFNAVYFAEHFLVRSQMDMTDGNVVLDTIDLPNGTAQNLIGVVSAHDRITCIGNGQQFNNINEIIERGPELFQMDITTPSQPVVLQRTPFVYPQEYGNERLIFYRPTPDQGFWVLTQEQHPNTGNARVRLVRTDSLGNVAFSTLLPIIQPRNPYYWIGNMEALADNGIVVTYENQDSLFLCKYLPDGTLSWLTLVDIRGGVATIDDIVMMPDGGFALYTKEFLTSMPGWLYRLDSQGMLKTVRRMDINGGIILKMLALPESGYLTFVNDPDGEMGIYALDLNGSILWHKTLKSVCSAWQANHFVRTADGGFLIMLLCASFEYATPTWIKLNARYEIEWSLPVLDGNYLKNPAVTEIPCKGFVFHSKVNYYGVPTADDNPMVFNHINQNGRLVQQDSAIYVPDAHFTSPDFVPGFSFAYWDDAKHGASRDLVLVRGAFPSVIPTFPPNQLSIAPNPSSTLTCIGFTNAYLGTVSVQLFDAKGALVQSFTEEKTDETWQKILNGSDLRSGLYVVRVTAGEEVLMGKWVKG